MNMTEVKAWWQSLGVWGSLGTIVVGILNALHIAHTPSIESDVNSWSAAAGVVIAGLITLYGRLRATKQIGTPTSPPPAVSMWLIVALGALLCMNIGCAQDPASRWAQARDTLSTTQNGIVAANQSGALADADFVVVNPYVQAVRGALQQAKSQLDAGNGASSAFDFYMTLAESTLENVAAAQSKLQPPNKEASNGDVQPGPRSDLGSQDVDLLGARHDGPRATVGIVYFRTDCRDPAASRSLGSDLRQCVSRRAATAQWDSQAERAERRAHGWLAAAADRLGAGNAGRAVVCC